jgi:hypothetical protein
MLHVLAPLLVMASLTGAPRVEHGARMQPTERPTAVVSAAPAVVRPAAAR